MTEEYFKPIENLKDLKKIKNNPSKNYKLIDDIEASSTSNKKKGFKPIKKFKGKIKGNGYSIKNLYINRPKEKKIGFIKENKGIIKNLNFENLYIKGLEFVGGVAGYNRSKRNKKNNINSVKINNSTITGKEFIGGIAGVNFTQIKNCEINSKIKGKHKIGGIVGLNKKELSKCSTTGIIKGENITGGIAGQNKGLITKCNSSCNTKGPSYIGGLIGANTNNKITKSYFHGKTDGGIIAGINKSIIKNCFYIEKENKKIISKKEGLIKNIKSRPTVEKIKSNIFLKEI